MLKLLKWVGSLLLIPVVLVVVLMPLGGLVYLAALIVSGIILLVNTFGFGESWITNSAIVFLQYGWKIYIGMAIFTMIVMTTFAYQNCCIGLSNFRGHLRHAKTGHFESLLIALTWPYAIFAMDRNLQSWMTGWPQIVFDALEFWFYRVWKGGTANFTFFDLEKGTITTTEITPETASEVLKDSLKGLQ